MTTVRNTLPTSVVLSLPNKLNNGGKPVPGAQWRTVTIPPGSLFTFYEGAGLSWLTTLVNGTIGLESAADPGG